MKRLIYSILFVCSVLVAQTPTTEEECIELQEELNSAYYNQQYFKLTDIKFANNKRDSLDLAPYLDEHDPRLMWFFKCASESAFTVNFTIDHPREGNEVVVLDGDHFWFKVKPAVYRNQNYSRDFTLSLIHI